MVPTYGMDYLKYFRDSLGSRIFEEGSYISRDALIFPQISNYERNLKDYEIKIKISDSKFLSNKYLLLNIYIYISIHI